MAYVPPPSYAPPKGYGPPDDSAPPPPNYGQQPPPPGYGQQTGVTMITHRPPGQMQLGQHPVNITCPSCSQNIQTRAEFVNGVTCWLICVICLLFGLWCGCCLIPFFVDACKDVQHSCPNCNMVIGKYEPISLGPRPVYIVHTSY